MECCFCGANKKHQPSSFAPRSDPATNCVTESLSNIAGYIVLLKCSNRFCGSCAISVFFFSDVFNENEIDIQHVNCPYGNVNQKYTVAISSSFTFWGFQGGEVSPPLQNHGSEENACATSNCFPIFSIHDSGRKGP